MTAQGQRLDHKTKVALGYALEGLTNDEFLRLGVALQVDLTKITGITLAKRVRSLISYMDMRQQGQKLIDSLLEMRPDLEERLSIPHRPPVQETVPAVMSTNTNPTVKSGGIKHG